MVGWALADHMRTELVTDALAMAFANRAPQERRSSTRDRGRQYTGSDFAELARANGVVLSVGRKGECPFTGYYDLDEERNGQQERHDACLW